MSGRIHNYTFELAWDGDRGSGTSDYRAFGREHHLHAAQKPDMLLSSDSAFRGDGTRWNPEELLVASLSSCHMLWYLHLASEAGLIVRDYRDAPVGRMIEDVDGSGRFVEVVLHPQVTLSAGDPEAANSLHHAAHAKCFVASSVNFPVLCEPRVTMTTDTAAQPALA